ncbi:MAG: sugar phosphate isomerase/epimerase [Lentisphaerae bacterium]|mgnify:FL=1|jgi:sugar phosphate isomerase/epimerase|nr:sugar phosphate isomerase/epimerase [Lentisphaerota bacterium]MBT4816225.1 sugar phosphate isomerase/epimerase [Lentisphaerota bacterium]MBT5610767.1 sugar phosphate isomerase/epimerase [Lentisphaerota bacterium]MBT7060849.1 sugar phosphate isomerase/epimerase [Lentisphaerota bacterium]MBT7841262.1 sugar phosphate isomerase/epimerase [Lentisphaerota bacterium]
MTDYSISAWIVRDLPLAQGVSALASAGFASVELSADQCPLVQEWERDPVGLCTRLEGAGLTVPSIHCPQPGRFLDAADENARLDAVVANLRYLERMALCGVDEIVIHPTGAGGGADVAPEDSRARTLLSLQTLAARAGELGLRLAVENIGFKPGRPDSDMASLLTIIDGLGDHVGLCLDIGHTEIAGLDMVEELTIGLESGKLFTLHLHDVLPSGKDHVIPGEGRVDFTPFLAALNAAKFSGGRTLEIAPGKGDVAARLAQVSDVKRCWEVHQL